MKRIFTILLAATVAVAAYAQPKAIGARFGYNGVGGAEVSYEHFTSLFGSNEFLEAELGLYGNNGFKATGLYNFTVWQPSWTDRGDWGLYLGPGLGVGYGTYKDKNDEWKGSPLFDFVAQVGLEYTFWFPLQLSVDFRPSLGYLGGFNPHWWGLNLAVRYAF